MNKLSKPVAEIKCHEDLSLSVVNVRDGFSLGRHQVYSQEYVSALLAELEAKDKRIAELEDKLATPVRLPVVLMGYQSDDYRIGFMEGVEKSGDEVRAAGFTVEGDE